MHPRDDLDQAPEKDGELIHSLGGIVWEADAATLRFRFVSARAEAILGYPVQQWLDEADFWIRHLHPDDVDRCVSLCREATREQRDHTFDYRMLASDGRIVWLCDSVVIVKDGADGVRLRGVMLDITDRKQADEHVLQARKLDAIGQLAGGIAHEFNNVLTVITGYTETLLASVDPATPQASDALEILRAAERAAMITQQLLAFSRKRVVAPELIDVGELVSETSAVIERLIGRQIELRVNIAAGAAPVTADRGEIEQVLMNLAANARDAMPLGGTLAIATECTMVSESRAEQLYPLTAGRYVLLSMTDSGAGMPADVRARAFEPFFTTKGIGKGTGIGLSTVYGIVKRSGGFVFIDSEPGRGTRFDIYLPLIDGPAADGRVDRGGAAKELASPATILLVEDYGRVRELTEKVLVREGHRVLSADSGPQALRLLRDHADRIDLVLTDVVMAPMTGPELVERLEALRPGVPVLYMSGYTGDRLGAHGVVEAGVGFIEKPFTPASLVKKVNEILAGAKEDRRASEQP